MLAELVAGTCGVVGLVWASRGAWRIQKPIKLPSRQRLGLADKGGVLGSAQFMGRADEKRVAMCGGALIVGRSQHTHAWLKIPLEGHGFTFAPPRSGKFTCGISPNLAEGWSGPIVSIGPKGEEYALWSEHRRKFGRKPLLIDPFSTVSRRFGIDDYTIIINPFDSIRTGENQVQDIGAIVDALIASNARGDSHGHFVEGARRFLSGLFAFVIHHPDLSNNLDTIWELLNTDQEAFEQLLTQMLDSDAGFGLARQAASLFLAVDPKERGSFISTLTNNISFLRYPQLRGHEQQHGIAELLNDPKVDLFIVPPAEILSDVAPWVRLQIALIIHQIKLHGSPQRILMMIDEIAALGHIKAIPETINLGAGYGISIWGFSQSILDLERVYGRETARSMIAASQFTQFFNVSMADRESQRIVSELLGEITIKIDSKSRSDSGRGIGAIGTQSSVSQSESLQRQPLLTPSEVGQLPGDACIVLLQHPKLPRKPLLCRKGEVFSSASHKALG